MTIFKTNDGRNKMLRKNILFSALLKAVGLLTSLLIVPVTLDYLDNEVYGIWMTMSSILYWFSFFDVGLGNGMRNYLTQSLSCGDYKAARSYLSTTFLLLACIALGAALLCVLPLTLLDMNSVFNTAAISGDELRAVMIVAVSFTLILFVVKNVGYIFVALQKYAVNDLLIVAGNVAALFIIYILTKTTESNLLYVVLAFTAIPVLVYFIACIPIFRRYPQLLPTRNGIDKSLAKKIVGKGLGFFFIQITSCLVIYGSSNLFITQFSGPESVTTYNIAYRFFNLLAIAYTIVISPMWSAYTDAYVKGDMQWIASTFGKAIKLWLLSVVGGAVMLGCSGAFYSLWIGDAVNIPFEVSLCVWLYISMFNFNNCVTYLLNGLNKIRVQIYTSVIVTAAYLVFIYFIGHRIGMVGIVLGMAVAYALMAVVHYYQCRLLIAGSARGVWNK